LTGEGCTTDPYKVLGSRYVPLKILGGLYRAGVAELIRHIIRIGMMSTKIWRLFANVAGNGLKILAIQVSPIEILLILRPIHGILLLLDLFIYLNFEQKQLGIHHRQFVDIYNLHGRNIAPAVPFILHDITPIARCDVIMTYFDKKIKHPPKKVLHLVLMH